MNRRSSILRRISFFSYLVVLSVTGCDRESSDQGGSDELKQGEDGPARADDCEAVIEEAYDACIAGGGDEVACREEAGEVYRACEGHEENSECEWAAEEAYNACIVAGGEQQACREEAGEVYRACEGHEENPECEASAEEAYDACIAAGGEQQACREEAGVAYEGCASGESDARAIRGEALRGVERLASRPR
ncbi:MAG: hypothetical protein AAGF11_53705 [Myxococcota bacterium]